MASGPVRWPWIASSVPSETFPIGVRFRGWMSEAEGFLCSRLLASLTWPARPGSARLAQPRLSVTIPRSQAVCRLTRSAVRPVVPPVPRIACVVSATRYPGSRRPHLPTSTPVGTLLHPARACAPAPGTESSRHAPAPPAHSAPSTIGAPGAQHDWRPLCLPAPGSDRPAVWVVARSVGRVRGSVSMVFRVCCRIVTC